jgi:hypothetical protein
VRFNWIIFEINENAKFETKLMGVWNLRQSGIRGFGTGYLMTGRFRVDDAIVAAARVAHLATKIMIRDFTPIQPYEGQDIHALSIENPDWNFLNRLKRQPDKSTFFYWYHTVQLF